MHEKAYHHTNAVFNIVYECAKLILSLQLPPPGHFRSLCHLKKISNLIGLHAKPEAGRNRSREGGLWFAPEGYLLRIVFEEGAQAAAPHPELPLCKTG